jgi:thiol-disulfide isomerase/thioredoxin
MAPVVHGLEKEYENRIDFLYLYVSDPKNADAKQRLGFRATPHFFFLTPDGSVVMEMQGVVPADSVRRALERLAASPRR